MQPNDLHEMWYCNGQRVIVRLERRELCQNLMEQDLWVKAHLLGGEEVFVS